MIFDTIQGIGWLTVIGWWAIRGRRWGWTEKTGFWIFLTGWWTMNLIEHLHDDDAFWACVSTVGVVIAVQTVVNRIVDEVERREAVKRWAKYDAEQALFRRQAQAWMHGEDWRDVK